MRIESCKREKLFLAAYYLLLALAFVAIIRLILLIIEPSLFLTPATPYVLRGVVPILFYLYTTTIYFGLFLIYITWEREKPHILFFIIVICIVLLENLGWIHNILKLVFYELPWFPLLYSIINFIPILIIPIIIGFILKPKPKNIALIMYLIYHIGRAVIYLSTLIVFNVVDVFSENLAPFQIIGDILGYVLNFLILIALGIYSLGEIKRLKGL